MPWTVAGQDAAVRILTAAIAGERVAHAYLFAGPAHTGKALTATQFAQALNCTAEGAGTPPCGACRSCEKIAGGAHPDVEFVGIGAVCVEDGHDHAKDNSRDIRICQVRRIEQIVSRAPYEGRRRVIIIDPADALNVASISALLKTLEEPPPYVVFVLVTSAEEVLLDTVRSRARRVAFGGQSRELIERTLRTHWNAEPAEAAELARLSGGRLGWAIAALRDPKLLDKREDALDRCEELAQSGLAQRFAAAGTLGSGYSRDRAGTQAVLELWQEWWRDLLLVAAGRDAQIVNAPRLDTLRPLAAQCDVAPVVTALRAIADARQQLIENASPTLTLEAMMLALPRLQPNAVAARLRN
jgi:DNA polymerase-3 subunit delta'